MKKKETSKPIEKKEEPKVQETPESKIYLSPEEMSLRSLIDSAKEPETPNIEDLQDIGWKNPLDVEKYSKGAEYAYCWLSFEEFKKGAYKDSHWVVVNKNTHDKIPYDEWDSRYGCILKFGENILHYCRREHIEFREKQIADAFNFKADKATEVKGSPRELGNGEVGFVDPGSLPAVSPDQPPVELDPGAIPDYVDA